MSRSCRVFNFNKCIYRTKQLPENQDSGYNLRGMQKYDSANNEEESVCLGLWGEAVERAEWGIKEVSRHETI